MAQPADATSSESFESQPSTLREARRLQMYYLACFGSNLGGWMQSGAVPYLVYQQTHSAWWVGIAGFATFLPSTLATLPGGVLADRYPKTPYLAATQALLTVVTLGLLATSMVTTLSTIALLLFVAAQSLLLGLSIPAFQTVVGELAPPELTAKAINVNSAQAQVAKTIGPVAAGLVLAHAGASWAFGVNAASYLFITVVLLLLCRNLPPHVTATNHHDSGKGMVTAAKAMWNHPTRRLVLLLVAVTMGAGAPLYQFISVIADERLHAGASSYGVLLGLYGFGAVLGNILIGRQRAARSTVFVLGAAAYGLTLIVNGMSQSIVLTGIAIAASGTCYLVTSVTLLTSIQLCTPAYLRGRVVAIYSFAYVGAIPLGSLLQGWMAEQIGLAATLVIAGFVVLSATAVLTGRPSIGRYLDADESTDVVDLREEPTATAAVPATAG